MNFTGKELRKLIWLCDTERYMHLGMRAELESSEAWINDDPDQREKALLYQAECISFFDGLLSRLYCLLGKVEASEQEAEQ